MGAGKFMIQAHDPDQRQSVLLKKIMLKQ